MKNWSKWARGGLKYPEYQLLEAYLLHLEGEDDQKAEDILERYQNKSFNHNELEQAGIYLYLCTLTGLYRDKEQALRKIQNFQMQKEDSYILLKLVFEMDQTLSPSRKIFLMEELFERGCTSPFLYLEAWNSICRDMSLLHRMNRVLGPGIPFCRKREHAYGGTCDAACISFRL